MNEPQNHFKFNRWNFNIMKRIVLLIAIFIFTIALSSCKAGHRLGSSKGCGLTSDAAPIHKTVLTEKV